jgi:hypothetical protein
MIPREYETNYPSVSLPYCPDCGCYVADGVKHNKWHDEQEPEPQPVSSFYGKMLFRILDKLDREHEKAKFQENSNDGASQYWYGKRYGLAIAKTLIDDEIHYLGLKNGK